MMKSSFLKYCPICRTVRGVGEQGYHSNGGLTHREYLLEYDDGLSSGQIKSEMRCSSVINTLIAGNPFPRQCKLDKGHGVVHQSTSDTVFPHSLLWE